MPIGSVFKGAKNLLGSITGQNIADTADEVRGLNRAQAARIGQLGKDYRRWGNQQAEMWGPNARWGGRFGSALAQEVGLPSGQAGWGDVAARQARIAGDMGTEIANLQRGYATDVGNVGNYARGHLYADPMYRAQMDAMERAQNTAWGNAGGFLSGAAMSARNRAAADIAGNTWGSLYNRRQQELAAAHQARLAGVGSEFGGQSNALNALQQPYSQLLGQQYNIGRVGREAQMNTGVQSAQANMGANNAWGGMQAQSSMMPLAWAQAAGSFFGGPGVGGMPGAKVPTASQVGARPGMGAAGLGWVRNPVGSNVGFGAQSGGFVG